MITSAKKENLELKAVVSKLVRNGITMEIDKNLEPCKDASKIGGKPLLPVDFIWPTYTNKEDNVTRPLSFFCQLNLAELVPYDKENVLPKQGMLYFFYECESFCWGFDLEDAGAAKVFFFEDLTDFVPCDIPIELSEEYVIPELSLKFNTAESYPSYEEFDVLNDSVCKWDEYDNILSEFGIDVDVDYEEHKILGYANLFQGEMITECENVTNGMYCGDDTLKKACLDKAKNWMLLLQLGTIEKDEFQLMFGDCGMLYYYIKKEDLAEKRFDRIWFAVQCY